MNRFWGPPPPQPAGTSTNAGCRAGGGTGGQQPPDGGAARMESLVLSGVVPLNGAIESFRVLRKPVLPSVFANASGDWALTAFDANGAVLHKIPFRIRTSPAEGDAPESRSFSVVVPWEKQLSRISIADEQGKVVFEKSASAHAPVLTLLSPQPGDVWQTNQGEGQPIEWLAMDSDQDAMRVFVQYSPDLGETWHPLAWLDENQKRHLVDIKDLEATEKALIYVSVTDGLHSDAVILPGAFAVRTGQ